MTPELKPSCSNCKFFGINERLGGRTECRHRSPTASRAWPEVNQDDLCGDWSAGISTMKMTCEACGNEFSAAKSGGASCDGKPFQRIVCSLCDTEGKDTTSFLSEHPQTDYRLMQAEVDAEVQKSREKFKKLCMQEANDNL